MGDAARRQDEAEALAAIFGQDFVEISAAEWHIHCSATGAELTLCLPEDYPSCSPPDLTLDIPRRGDLAKICQELKALFAPGEEVGYIMADQFYAFCMSEEPTVQIPSTLNTAAVDVAVNCTNERSSSQQTQKQMSKAEKKAEDRARKMAQAAFLENMTFDEAEKALDKYGEAHAAGVEEGWLHI